MAHQHTTIHLDPTDAVVVNHRQHGPGCVIHFGTGASVFLTPQEQADLIAKLLARAMPMGAPELPEGGNVTAFRRAEPTTTGAAS